MCKKKCFFINGISIKVYKYHMYKLIQNLSLINYISSIWRYLFLADILCLWMQKSNDANFVIINNLSRNTQIYNWLYFHVIMLITTVSLWLLSYIIFQIILNNMQKIACIESRKYNQLFAWINNWIKVFILYVCMHISPYTSLLIHFKS